MSINFNNNKSLQIDRNPGMWNGRNDIKKEIKSIHTKRIDKLGTDFLTDMHRSEDMFDDRFKTNINLISKGTNIMAKKGDINYGGNPFKIDNNEITQNKQGKDDHALSRKPITNVNMHTNNFQKRNMSSEYYQNNNLKSIRDEYLKTDIQPTKILYRDEYKKGKEDDKVIKLQNKVNYSTFSNKTVSNNYNNAIRNNDQLPIQEKTNISLDTYKSTREYKSNNYVDTSNNIRNGIPITDVMSVKTKTKYETRNKNNNFNLQSNRPTPNIHTNLQMNSNQVEQDRPDFYLQSNRPTPNMYTNIQKNSNEVEHQRQHIQLQSNRPKTNVQTNIRRNHNEVDAIRQNVQLGSSLQLGSYNNNRTGLRQSTTNLNFVL